MLNSAHQGYIYQDILGAYFIAVELAQGRLGTEFLFDLKKTPTGTPDKFDDIFIKRQTNEILIQVKYSNDLSDHTLTKDDFSTSSNYDLALYDLFKTWKALNKSNTNWKVLLAWNAPHANDPINKVLIDVDNGNQLFLNTRSYRFDCETLWPEGKSVIPSWRKLKKESVSIDRSDFKDFLGNLSIELECPKSTLLESFDNGIEKLLYHAIIQIGIGEYPNDHLSARQVAERLVAIVNRQRARDNQLPMSTKDIADEIGIRTSYGGIEQRFPIDEKVLIATPDRIDQVVNILEDNKYVILTAEPGAGKSWFIENLQRFFEKEGDNKRQVVKHYCYTALNDPLVTDRITTNVLYGSLITQIINHNSELHQKKTKRYASNLEELNILLSEIKEDTLLIIDGIDHIWRVYQKNRGGMTEGQTTILQALSKLDLSNPNVSLLVVSQPISELDQLPTKFYRSTLSRVSESFVKGLLNKNSVSNNNTNGQLLSEAIHKKSKGNALYCKYLIDYFNINSKGGIAITELPEYDFNLTSYYNFLYEEIRTHSAVAFALCGADFSLTEYELIELTRYGGMVSEQLQQLRPLLKFNSATGYSIYHESFKRFIVESLKEQGASIDHLVYFPIISWLESLDFFESPKAYGHLLKLYFEVNKKDKIIETIEEDFFRKSFYHAHPIRNIVQNHHLQKASLSPGFGFQPLIIVSEQSKIVVEFENLPDSTLIAYLEAVKQIHGNDHMYRVLWDGEKLLISPETALRFLVRQSYQKEKEIHWSIIPELKSIPYELLGCFCVRYLHQEKYDELDAYVREINEDPKHQKAFSYIKRHLDWWSIFHSKDWLDSTPYCKNLILSESHDNSLSIEALVDAVTKTSFHYDDNWEAIVNDLILAYCQSSQEVKEEVVSKLSNYNWFRNWVVYILKISDFESDQFQDSDVVDAFSYLVRRLEPFEGTPRTCDLYQQLEYIEKSFYEGLLLCGDNVSLLKKCCNLLEKVTELTTTVDGIYVGPLTGEKYLKIASHFLPMEDVYDIHTEYYEPLSFKGYYSEVAEIAFRYAKVLKLAGDCNASKARFSEGVQALNAYGYRKDRTFSEVLYCSVPFQQTYNSLPLDWFYQLKEMAWSVVYHTDGRSTRQYPVEWFEEFLKVYPEEASRFIAYETVQNEKSNWIDEESFSHFLEEYPEVLSPTQWFLLCRTVPLLNSEKIISYGLSNYNDISLPIKEVFFRWLKTLPSVLRDNEEPIYSVELAERFGEVFGIELETQEDSKWKTNTLLKFKGNFLDCSIDEGLALLEEYSIPESESIGFRDFILRITDQYNQRKALRLFVKGICRDFLDSPHDWVDNLFDNESDEGFYLNVCLFVYVRDGWFHGLNIVEYFEQAYILDQSKAIKVLEEVLCIYIADSGFTYLISCNLIKALSIVKVDENISRPLIELIYKIVKGRLPDPPLLDAHLEIKEGLKDFNQDEIVAVLLIARLKTLTTQKTQSIVWGLTYLAKYDPQNLIRPFIWALKNKKHFLPIHRVLILQLLKNYIEPKLIPDELVMGLLDDYPSGYFLEDQYVRSFVGYGVELGDNESIVLPPNQYDSLPVYVNNKYYTLFNELGGLDGCFHSYSLKKERINDIYKDYYLISEELMTPIIPLANAMYEVVNRVFYKELKELTETYGVNYNCDLKLRISEVIFQLGSLDNRPEVLVFPSSISISSSEIKSSSDILSYNGWVILASKEDEIVGETLGKKKIITLERTFYFGDMPESGLESYSRYLFAPELYVGNLLKTAPRDNPISHLTIKDTLEQSEIVFLAPWIIRELNLTISTNLHNGFVAYDSNNDEVVKVIKWKEKYFGDLGRSTEVPTLSGVAVMIKDTWYDKLLSLSKKSIYLFSSNTIEAIISK